MTINRALRLKWVMAAALAAMPMMAAAQEPTPRPQDTIEVKALLPEPAFIDRAIDFATRTMGDGGGGEKSGLYPEMSNMITGAGWLSLGPGYRYWYSDRLFIDGSAAMSWREYKMARGRIEFANMADRHAAVGAEVKWQDFTQNTYFGNGPDSLEANRSEYRLKSLNAVAYTNIRPVEWLTIGGRAGVLRSPTLLGPTGWFRRDIPPTATMFPDEAAFQLAEQPDFVHGELSAMADTRDQRSHPLRGGVYRGAWTRFSDRDSGAFSFQRFEAEGAHFLSSPNNTVTVAVHGWLIASDTAETGAIPFYLMPSLGGNNTLRSFANYRFHDRHAVVANVELRIALMAHIDAVGFMDRGGVASRMADLDFDKRSIGAGIRFHSKRATFFRVDVAHGSEGWRLAVNTSDPLHLPRLSRRMAAIPFAP
ncbi:MAG TPA: BamA/TamA family outer membrane protein [Vicinamibacterales bacterium]